MLIIDTAGRLQTKSNLMQELEKINRVIGREIPGAPHETLLVLDATTGQNAISQAELFTKAAPITGVVLTKLDGTAKGGVVIGIKSQLSMPVKWIGVGEGVEDLRPFNAEDFAKALLRYYQSFGYGDIASFKAFRWDAKLQRLIGIRHFEAMEMDDIIGYAHQKEQLIDNTEAFVQRKPANNVLLVGARGTGKSSAVKALANVYYSRGLRILQLTKPQLSHLPDIMDALRYFASKRFIIFLDDLSFEESDAEYKYLKSAIEGGVESRPENVLIYATSNRRHLIRESWRDRSESQDDVYRDDSMNETISLSDRFGLIIQYYAPDQKEYLAIIDHMLRKEGIQLTPEELRIAGVRWEMTHSGRSGRTAQQFVAHYLGQLDDHDE